MAEMITRCPTCGTSFRITDAQLKTAKGAVRCGSCLQIFRALDHLVSGKPEAAAAPKPSTTAPVQAAPQVAKAPSKAAPADKRSEPLPKFEYIRPAATSQPSPKGTEKPSTAAASPPAAATNGEGAKPSSPVSSSGFSFDQSAIDGDDVKIGLDDDDDNLLISDDLPLDDDEPVKKHAYGDDLAESFIDLDSWKPKEKSLFDREYKEPKFTADDDEDEDQADESWAIELLEESEEEEVEFSFQRPASPPSANKSTKQARPDTDEDYTQITTGSFSTLDDSDVEEALGAPLAEHQEPEFHPEDMVNFKPSFGREYETDDEDEDEDETAKKPQRFDEEAFGGDRYDEDYQEDYQEEGLYADEEDRGALLRRIQPEPVEFGFHRRHFNWRGKAIWGGLTLAGLGFLVFQIAWLQYETLSRKEPYRGWYQAVGWEVPTVAATKLIRASNLVVRSHPEVEDALMVDTILLNTASFSQPFPDLVLSFSNMQGQTLAARRFSPREYLGGEMAGRREMPSNQPIHLSLEIVDPGPDAVNYTAYIPEE